jgi:hypothetical protein
VARISPIKDRIDVTVRGFGSFTHRIQPQISTMGEARYPMAIGIPNINDVDVLNAKISSGVLYARIEAT